MTDDTLPQPNPGEHPFAPYVRILGKGRRGSRSLTRAEAREAMGMILRGDVEDMQLGAFLMLIRVKEETPDELAGFVDAVKTHIAAPHHLKVDLDWSSYAGKRRHAPWFILSIRLLLDAGLRVFMHGTQGHTHGRIYTQDVLAALGLPVANDWKNAELALARTGFAYLALDAVAPRLANLIELKPILGLRSPVHSLARLINPLDAPVVLQGIFHPPYAPLHQQAAALLGYPHLSVIKGEGGEIERNPDAPLTVLRTQDGELSSDEWPALFERRHVKPERLDADYMKAIWRGDAADEYAQAAVLSTAALALRETGKASCQTSALEQAQRLWEQRNRDRLALV
ncbi:MAG: glycosyl transferase family protein [Gammaproteobacteria bacterium]|nr:glycosyl transferase family protein [Gammaproteobacteria bacterium]